MESNDIKPDLPIVEKSAETDDLIIKTEIKQEEPDTYTNHNNVTTEAGDQIVVKTEVKQEEPDTSTNHNNVTTEAGDQIDVKTQVKEEPDLYSYTKLDDFTSEIYKIELCNLPNYVGYGQLRKLLNSTLNLNPRKVKAIGTPPQFAFITFNGEKDREKALNRLNGYRWKGKTLVAKKASPSADPMAKKRKAGDSEDCRDPKKAKADDIPIELRLKNAVTPFWNVPYEEQLRRKQDDVHKFLMKLSKGIERVNRDLLPILSKNRKQYHHQCCPVDPIIPSPVTTGYRNKCEFTTGRHLLTKEKTVGFRLNAYKEGSVSVAEPDDCINISPAMLKAVKSFEKYIRESEKDVYNPENHSGHWRQLTVRTSNNSDVLLIVVIHPQSLTEAELEEEKSKLKKYYEDNKDTFGVTSVYLQLFSKKASNDEVLPLFHLMGKEFLEESLLEMKFQVSPEAFFQINVPATEVLYKLVADLVNASPSVAVLDVCCGTGTISLCLAKAGAKVIGIEMCPEAVENARLNAQQNNVEAEFICGKAEDVIHTAVQKCEDSTEIIAVVDPPRAGLHQRVLKVLRATTSINKVIYISCNQGAAFTNFVDLCRPPSNNYRGSPFYPVKASVIDMFPYTPHKELVLVFKRTDTIET